MYSESKLPKASRISNSQNHKRLPQNLSVNSSLMQDMINSEESSFSMNSKMFNQSVKLLNRRTEKSTSTGFFGNRTPSLNRTMQPFKEISKEVLVMEPDNDPNLVRYRSTIINSKLQIDRTKISPDSGSRDISFLLDSKIMKGSRSNSSSQDPLSVISTDTQPVPVISLHTNLNELKQIFLTQDNLIDIDEISKLCPLNLIKRIPQEFLSMNLLKRDKNLFPKLGGPTGQKDADLLEIWLESMLSKVIDEKHTEDQKFEYSQIIYSTCLKEIARQVSVQCIKRGELLEKIWKAYIMLFLKTIKILHKNKQTTEKSAKLRITTLQDKYENTIEALMKEIESLQDKVNKIEQEKLDYKKQLELAEEREKKYIERLNILQNYYEHTIIRVHRLEDVNRNLNLVIAKTLDDYESESSGLKVLQYKQVIRFRDLKNLLASDPLLNKEICVVKPLNSIEAISNGTQEIELENRIFLNELQQKLEDCKHDMKDIGVDTKGLVKYLPAVSQTYPDDFVIPLVSVAREEKMIDIDGLTREILENNKTDSDVRHIKEESDEEGLELYEELAEISKTAIEEDPEMLIEISQKLSDKCTKIITKRFQHHQDLVEKLTSFLEFYNKKVEKLRVVKLVTKNLKLTLINKFITKSREPAQTDNLNVVKNTHHPLSSEENSESELQSSKSKQFGSKGSRKGDKSPDVKSRRGTIHRKTVPKEFNIGQKLKLIANKPKENLGKELLERHKSSKSSTKVLLTKQNLIKKVQFVFYEYSVFTDEALDLSEFLYYLLSKKFGILKVTESKYLQICAACDKYRSNAFIDIFGRFLGLRNFLNSADLKVYIQIQELFNIHSKEGVDVSPFDADNPFTPFDRAICIWNDLLKDKYPEEDMQAMRSELQTKVKHCPKNMNSSGVIDTYYLIYYLLDKNRNYLFTKGDELRDLFDAIDLEGKGYILFESFDLLFRCINPKEYDQSTCELIFENLSDRKVQVKEVELPAMSQYKFCLVTIAFNLFPKNLQDVFFEVSSPEQLTAELNKLRYNSENTLFNITWRYRISHELKPEKIENLNLLKEKILNPDNPKAAYFAYKIIDFESRTKIEQDSIKKDTDTKENLNRNRRILRLYEEFIKKDISKWTAPRRGHQIISPAPEEYLQSEEPSLTTGHIYRSYSKE